MLIYKPRHKSTHPTVDLVLFSLPLLLDHEERMIEQKHEQLPIIPRRSPKCTLKDLLPALIPQPQIDLLSRPEDQLLI